MAAHPSLCGGSVSSRRGLLASLWSIVVILTFMAFIVALIFTLSAKEERNDEYNYDNEEQPEGERDAAAEMAVTSRAMAFASLWTAVLATLMAIFGAVILGWQSPTGVYYTCCSAKVHKTTPLALGSFIGALLMFANLTLVCSVLFGEFEIRDYRDEKQANNNNNNQEDRGDSRVSRSSMAFSITCMFLTVLYASFAGLTFAFSKSVLEELDEDEMEDTSRSMNLHHHHHHGGYDGYIGERFDVRRPTNASGFVAPAPDNTII